MSKDFATIIRDHASDMALVFAEGNARSKVIDRLKACKTTQEQADAEVWLWAGRMIQYVMREAKVTQAKATDMVAIERAKKGGQKEPRADWYKPADSAARNYAFNVRKEAGLVAVENRGGKRDNAGRKGETEQTASPVAAAMAKAAKPETAKAEPAKPETVKDYKPANAKDAAMFTRQNIAALISICKPVSSKSLLKALNDALAAAQVEIKNCE